jgi:chromosome segregation ATPase
MNDSTITTLLEDLSARLNCEILAEDEMAQELNEQFSETRHHVSAVADELRRLADPGDALAFAGELSTFLAASRTKALEANRLREAIAERESRLADAREELGYLSAGRATLAEKVNAAMLALEEAQREYADLDLRLGIIERTIESTRLERSSLRRQMEELTKSKETRN